MVDFTGAIVTFCLYTLYHIYKTRSLDFKVKKLQKRIAILEERIYCGRSCLLEPGETITNDR